MIERYSIEGKPKESLHLAVGVAIHTWQQVEHQLGQVFAYAADLAPVEVQLMFNQILSFPLRVGLTDVVVRTSLQGDNDWLSRWKQICDYLLELASDRNYFAHNGMSSHSDGAEGTTYKIGRGTSKRLALDQNDIWELAEDFHSCWISLLLVESCVRNGESSRNKHRDVPIRRRPSRNERERPVHEENRKLRVKLSSKKIDWGETLEEDHKRYVSRPSTLK